ncbi:hypothetical protein SODALDRAFT_358179 [Sodiomyces alkalinus F11]|uniref:Uncharacterized protein n=1 Tax=Sodiomyces alkalinus (strain CBS 110278 / VKM F-3762 / F11) TaxID=1314773 RepID=A0A3N2PZ07_SODAK|nr:hypothetical protein SODALDRAFT_358179 [Sodiomyces alkalinus F11]ROT39763.1 hypothetical protein SODALDRAFT_358179 [Sodiomyces alkalinus F11]
MPTRQMSVDQAVRQEAPMTRGTDNADGRLDRHHPGGFQFHRKLDLSLGKVKRYEDEGSTSCRDRFVRSSRQKLVSYTVNVYCSKYGINTVPSEQEKRLALWEQASRHDSESDSRRAKHRTHTRRFINQQSDSTLVQARAKFLKTTHANSTNEKPPGDSKANQNRQAKANRFKLTCKPFVAFANGSPSSNRSASRRSAPTASVLQDTARHKPRSPKQGTSTTSSSTSVLSRVAEREHSIATPYLQDGRYDLPPDYCTPIMPSSPPHNPPTRCFPVPTSTKHDRILETALAFQTSTTIIPTREPIIIVNFILIAFIGPCCHSHLLSVSVALPGRDHSVLTLNLLYFGDAAVVPLPIFFALAWYVTRTLSLMPCQRLVKSLPSYSLPPVQGFFGHANHGLSVRQPTANLIYLSQPTSFEVATPLHLFLASRPHFRYPTLSIFQSPLLYLAFPSP